MRLLARLGIGAPAAIAALAWVLVAGYGASQVGSNVIERVRAERHPEDVQRNAAWSTIYGFADYCQSTIAPSAGVLLVDPTGAPVAVPAAERTGPAAFGLPGDLDWPNESVFAYVLYPRRVAALGHAPADWTAATASAPYVALWEQQSYRSAEARTAALQAEAELSAQAGAQAVCTYAGAGGDRGVVYYLGPGGVAAAPSAPASPIGGRAGAYLRGLAGVGSLWAVGFLFLSFLPRGRLPVGFTVGASLPLGCTAVTLELLGFSAARVAWSAPLLAAPWIVCGVIAAWRARRDLGEVARRLSRRSLWAAWHGSHLTERVAWVLLGAFGLAITVAAPLGLPWSDGFNLYYFKSRAFFADGSVLPYYQHASSMLFSFPAHPPLVSLSVTWLYTFLGEADEHVTLLLWPALFISMLCVLYSLARRRLSRQAAVWFLLAATLAGYEISTQALLASFSDLPLAVFLLLACGALWLWAGDTRKPLSLLVVAGIFLAGAALTKEEGLVAAGVVLAATPLLLGRDEPALSRARLAPLAAALPVFAILVLPWLVIRAKYHLPEMTVGIGGGSAILSRLPAAVIGLGARAALPLLPFAALALIAAFRPPGFTLDALRGRFYFVVLVAGVMLGMDAAAIAAAPVEVHHQLAIAGTRLVSQLLPLAFLASLDVWPLLAVTATTVEVAGGRPIPQRAALVPPA